jgi:hypothetical protein
MVYGHSRFTEAQTLHRSHGWPKHEEAMAIRTSPRKRREEFEKPDCFYLVKMMKDGNLDIKPIIRLESSKSLFFVS